MTRELRVFGEHTVDVSLLTPGGWVLDAGCRDFTFARGLAERGCQVIAIDADPTVEDPKINGVTFLHAALCDQPGIRQFFMHKDPQARFVIGESIPALKRPDVITVEATTIEQLMARFGVRRWDAVKLDVEGAEYDILRYWSGPIASQVSVEFHEHVRPRPVSIYNEIFTRLRPWYDVVQHELERRHCTGPNFWDSLFTLKPESELAPV